MLWPTARPDQAAKTHQVWYENARDRRRLKIHFSTTTPSDALNVPGMERIVVDHKCNGVCGALHELCQTINPDDNDVIVVVSDDIHPPPEWDVAVDAALERKRGMLWVADGWHDDRAIIAMPICDGATFKRLNRIIYHPSYRHLWSDNELHQNCKDLGLLVDVRHELPFEHRHYYAGKRHVDAVDVKIQSWQERDRQNWIKRSKMTVEERLGG